MREPSALRRRQDWPEIFAEQLDARAQAPFVWGTNDCCTLACDMVLALAGVDPMAEFRGGYSDEAGAEVILSSGGGLAVLADRVLLTAGLGACHPRFAQRGDVALVEHGNTRALGVIVGDSVAVPGPDGLSFLPLSFVLRAWSV
jgi:hypothetical protein